MRLHDFYFAHDGLFVIPIEHLGPEGMTQPMAEAVAAHGRSSAWIARFDAAFRAYWQRAASLYARAPETWFPPRRQHVCIARALEHARPYSQPFADASWLMYEADFDPDTSSVELSTFLFFHTERLSVARNVMAAGVHNLAYFFDRSAEEIADFQQGCRRSTRPDAPALCTLADAMDWTDRVYHTVLKRPTVDVTEPVGKLEAADLLVPLSLQPSIKAMAASYRAVGEAVVRRYSEMHPEGGDDTHANALIDWLRRDVPRVLITGGSEVLWDPEQPDDSAAFARAVKGISQAPAASVRADLTLVADRTTRLLALLRDPQALPRPHELDQDAGAYIHERRQLIAYDLLHPRMNRLREPSPPYERLMLGARTVHEWGHLAVDAGHVHVPAERQATFEERQRDVAATFDALIARASSELREVAAEEARLLDGDPSQPGAALTETLMGRMEDFMANLLARAVLSVEEMETYVRANVVSRSAELQIGPWLKLARYAYEFQYLRLSRIEDPHAYFFDSTWFRQHHIEAGVVSEHDARALFDGVAKVCNCYALVRSAFVDDAFAASPLDAVDSVDKRAGA